MLTTQIRAKDITRYSKPLIWIAAKRDRIVKGPSLTGILERHLRAFLLNEKEEKIKRIKELEYLIEERRQAITARQKNDDGRLVADHSYIANRTSEIQFVEELYDIREQKAKELIETKIKDYERYRGI